MSEYNIIFNINNQKREFMKKRLTMFLAAMLLCVGTALAQTKVSGTVLSQEDGQPIIGAAVKVVGTSTGMLTDVNGRFNVTLPAGKNQLEITYLGYEGKTVTAKNGMRVFLQSDAAALDEVIVVAYGTAKKSAFTGSAATLKSDDIIKRQVSSALNALTGAVSGVQVTAYNGQPGTDPTIRIRGVGSMSANSKPLYVVDGVPYDGNITNINPSDIESMNVLKDASASAIYGSRGANGVVIITTKQGQRGQEAKVTLDAKWGVNNRAVPNYDVISSPATYYETMYRALYNEGFLGYEGDSEKAHAYANKLIFSNEGCQVYTVPEGQDFIGQDFRINPNAKLGYSDGQFYYTPDNWYDEMFNTGNLRQEYNANVSGSSDKINYFLSLGYLDDKGIINSSSYKRYTARLKADYQAKSWLKVGANISYTHARQSAPGAQNNWGSSGNAFYIADNIAPIYPIFVRNADGSFKYDAMGLQVLDTGTNTNQKRKFSAGNPLIDLRLNKYKQEINSINAKGFAIIDLPLEGLKFTANLGAYTSDNRENNLYNPHYGASSSTNGAVNVNHYRRLSIDQQYLLTYQHDFGMHSLDLLAGYESYETRYRVLEAGKQNIFFDDVAELDNAIKYPAAPKSSTNRYSTKGWLARAQYNYAQKYFASVSFRRDGSSRFADGHKWGSFGSIGAAWLISKEDFMKSTSSWLDELKLKASYGIQGNDNLMYNGDVMYYPYADGYTITDVNGTAVPIFNGYKGNKDITWETSYSTNLGIEFSLWKGRLSGSFEYYNRTTKDMLYYKPVPVSMGYDSYPINSGKMYNRGIELNLTGTVLKLKDVEVALNMNLTTIKNKVTSYPDVNKSGMRIIEEGGSIYESYLRTFAGVYHGNDGEYKLAEGFTPDLGDALYYSDPDNGDFTVTDYTNAKQAHQGSTLANVFGGFGLTAKAYGFDASIQFAYQLGGKLYDHKYQGLMASNGKNGQNWHTDIFNAWTPENPNSNIPRLDTGVDDSQNSSSRFLVSSDYLSMANITIGYSVPTKYVQMLHLSGVRVYFAGDNLALWTARKGLDPRRSLNMGVATLGGGYSDTYAGLKTVSGGITVTF